MKQTDILIIGSGVAAAALSQRLLMSDPKAKILIIEAGTSVAMQDFKLWEDFLLTNVPPYDAYRDLAFPQRDFPGENQLVGDAPIEIKGARVLAMGGSTHHWGGWAFRMKPEDFQLKSKVLERDENVDAVRDCIDWPISYDDLEPFYCEAEHYIGVSGDSSDTTVRRSCDYPFTPFPYTLEDEAVGKAMRNLGYSYGNLPIARQGVTKDPSHRAPCQTTGTCKYCPFGARYAAANFLDFMRDHAKYENFEILTNCIVEEILMSSPEKATGISYVDKAGNLGEITAEKIIVAAGSIESAKLLLRSKGGNWQFGLGNPNENGFVGRNFITHPYFIFSGVMATNKRRLQPEMDFPTLCSRHFDSEEEQAKGKFILVNPSGSPVPSSSNMSSVSLASMMKNGYSRTQIEEALTGKIVVQLHGMVEFFSQYANRVENSIKRNHIGLIETRVTCNRDSGIKERIVDIESVVGRIFEKMGVTDISLSNYSWRADHAAAVCRMGKDASEAVVDSDLKIFGVENVYVLSNAVMPNIGCVNPTLTLTALSLRLGEHLGGKTEIDKSVYQLVGAV
jgi:choline dehydrogenase-like flavoprotein